MFLVTLQLKILHFLVISEWESQGFHSLVAFVKLLSRERQHGARFCVQAEKKEPGSRSAF